MMGSSWQATRLHTFGSKMSHGATDSSSYTARRRGRGLELACHSPGHMCKPALASASGFRVHTDVLDGISRI
jgi:hypothetical protein